jgi:hypothetical protein
MDDGGRDEEHRDDDAAWEAWEWRAEKRIRDEYDPEGSGLRVKYPDGTWAGEEEDNDLWDQDNDRWDQMWLDDDIQLQADILSGRHSPNPFVRDMLGVPPHPPCGLWGYNGMPYYPGMFRRYF